LYPLDSVAPNMGWVGLVQELSKAQQTFDFADPKRLADLVRDDPVLRAAFPRFEVSKAWLWQNGPETRFLVYASELRRS